MRNLLPGCCAVALLAGVTIAQEPTTKPSEPRGQPFRQQARENFRERIGQGPRQGEGPGRPGEGPRAVEPPSASEWDEITGFLQQNQPNRWKAFEEVRSKRGDDSDVIKGLKGRLAQRYRMLKRLQGDGTDAYDAALEQVKLEDDVWALAREFKANPKNKDLEQELGGKVKNLVESLLDERQRRINNMEDALIREKNRLADDRENFDTLVQQHLSQLMSDGTEPPPRRPMGPGPGQGRRPRGNDSEPPR